MRYETFDSPVGELLAVGDRSGLRGLHLQAGPRPAAIDVAWVRDRPLFAPLREQLGEYFAGRRRSFALDLAPAGTPFQRVVWGAVGAIEYGKTDSYRDLAARIGRLAAWRAVGAANGANPLPIVVPCHRLIGAAGALTGYAGGVERKRWLLELERTGAAPDIRGESATAA